MTAVPLRYIAAVNEAVLPENTPPDFSFKYIDISQVDGNGKVTIPAAVVSFDAAPSRARRVATAGSTVVSTVRTYLRAIGTVPDSKEPLIFSTGFAVLRPTRGDPRYFGYACRSDNFVQEVASRSVGVSYPAISTTDLMGIRLPSPDSDEQRRIADFLDDRVARIDQIIAARLRQIDLMSEVDRAAVDRHLGSKQSEQMTRLGRIAYIQTGLTIDAGRATNGSEVTLPYLRVANVQADRVDLSELKEVTVPIEMAARSTLRVGDVLMTEGGDLDKLGRGTIWNGDVNRCLHQNHVFAVRTMPSHLSPEFLALYTRTSDARRHFESTGSRSTNLASTSSAKVLDLRVPFRSLGQQHEAVRAYQAESDRVTSGKRAIADQAGLFQEYKQSLITAAVTGELDVTTAGSGIPG